MAPEQCRGEDVDARTDIYSLGVTTYEILTLDRPFKGDTEETTGSRGERVRWEQMNVPPSRPTNVNPVISPAAEAAILRALEKDPVRRQQQALHFYQELSAGGEVQPAVSLLWGGTATPVATAPALAVDRAPTLSEAVERPSKAALPWLVGGVGAVLGLVALAVLLVVALLVLPRRGTEGEAATLVAQLTADAQTVTAEAALQAAHPEQTLEPEPETPSPAPEPTNTPMPTATFTPFPTPTPSPTPTPTPACPGVSGPFAGVWSAVQDRIGCATGSHSTTWAAEETFENGWMYWRKDNGKIYAVYNWGRWEVYANAWYEGDPEFSCTDAHTPAQSPPTPKRGFGKIWCTHSGVRQGLGGATEGERGFDVIVQHFERGFILRTDRWTWVFYDDDSWERR